MKKVYYTILLSLIGATVYSQPTLTNITNFSIGDKAWYHTCDTAGFKPGSAGANVTWDFSNISVKGPFEFKVIDKSQAQFGSQYPDADFVEVSIDGSEAYIKNTSTDYSLVAAEQAGVLISYPDNLLLTKRPVTYNDVFTDNYTTSYTYLSYSLSGSGSSTTTADGYGTLVLPDTTYNNVLRMHVNFSQTDKISGFPPPSDEVKIKGNIYIWLDAFHKAPLMRYDSLSIESLLQNTLTKKVFFIDDNPVSVNEVTTDAINIEAYISNSQVLLSADFNLHSKHVLRIYNSGGALVETISFVPETKKTLLPTKDLPTGNYILSVQEIGNNPVAIKVFKQ